MDDPKQITTKPRGNKNRSFFIFVVAVNCRERERASEQREGINIEKSSGNINISPKRIFIFYKKKHNFELIATERK